MGNAAMNPQPGTDVVKRIARPRSLSAIVVEQIRDLIITDRLGLGEQLSEQTLAEQLGVSRTPVREAFLKLQTERLVEVKPQRGTFVFQYDTTELREICELREVLETGALRVAIKHGRHKVIKALRAQLRAAAGIVRQGPAAYQPHDTAFHETLVQASGNRELIAAYEKISGRVRAIRFRLTTTLEQIQGSQRDHGLVVEALVAGNDAEAEAALGRHVYNGYWGLVRMAEQARGKAQLEEPVGKA
jgi:DNA-binding GntR family transcriptional regulator